MERRRRSERRPSTGRLKSPPKASSPWPHIEEFIDYCDGNISIGRVHPIACAAVASDPHNMLAALVRRKDESFLELLARLDQAIDRAVNEHVFTDEINR